MAVVQPFCADFDRIEGFAGFVRQDYDGGTAKEIGRAHEVPRAAAQGQVARACQGG